MLSNGLSFALTNLAVLQEMLKMQDWNLQHKREQKCKGGNAGLEYVG